MKKFLSKLPSILIILTISSIVFFMAISSISTWIQKQSNYYVVSESLYRCEKVTTKESNNQVVLRLDDVQGDAFRSASKRMIDDAINHNMPLVIGVIPKGLDRDKDIVRFIKNRECNLEIALHGWDHSILAGEKDTFEFENLSEQDAETRLQLGISLMKRILNVTPLTFIPPGNRTSVGTDEALKVSGIKYISADNGKRLDMSAYTFDFPYGELVPEDDVMEMCDLQFSEKLPCVIVLHPQDYMTNGIVDEGKYATYIHLLDRISQKDISVTTFDHLK